MEILLAQPLVGIWHILATFAKDSQRRNALTKRSLAVLLGHEAQVI